MNKKIDMSKETVPAIFQVRSSRASFLKLTASVLSFLKGCGGGAERGAVLRSGTSVFSSFSRAGWGIVDFFSLLAMGVKGNNSVIEWASRSGPQ